MAYRRRYNKKAKAGKVAKRVARKAYKGALRMPKRKLAKMYATKCGQSAFRAVRGKKKGFGRKRRMRRMRY